MKDKKRKRLPPYLVKQRLKIFYQIWEEQKADLSMQELADILNFPLDQFFKILKEAKELPSHNKSFKQIDKL